jgi:flavin-dependent dehydrogenase
LMLRFQISLLGGAIEAELVSGANEEFRARFGRTALFCLGAVPWGYAWVFPKGDGLSVGICQFRPGRVGLRAGLRREMVPRGIRLNGVRLHGHALPGYQAPPWPFWRHRPQERLSTRRCVLVGDATGLVDPLLAEGIRYAISSARLAARAILKEICRATKRSSGRISVTVWPRRPRPQTSTSAGLGCATIWPSVDGQ